MRSFAAISTPVARVLRNSDMFFSARTMASIFLESAKLLQPCPGKSSSARPVTLTLSGGLPMYPMGGTSISDEAFPPRTGRSWMKATLHPWRAAATAAPRPAGPPPTTTTSYPLIAWTSEPAPPCSSLWAASGSESPAGLNDLSASTTASQRPHQPVRSWRRTSTSPAFSSNVPPSTHCQASVLALPKVTPDALPPTETSNRPGEWLGSQSLQRTQRRYVPARATSALVTASATGFPTPVASRYGEPIRSTYCESLDHRPVSANCSASSQITDLPFPKAIPPGAPVIADAAKTTGRTTPRIPCLTNGSLQDRTRASTSSGRAIRNSQSAIRNRVIPSRARCP